MLLLLERVVCVCVHGDGSVRESLQNKKKLILPLIIHLCQLEGSNQKQLEI